MTSLRLNRRAVLRGALGGVTASLALPALEAMLDDHGTAYAQGIELPKRLGVWFWGNGIRHAHWVPDQTGPDWVAKEELAPLVGVKRYLNLVTGTSLPWGNEIAHHVGRAGMLTGSWNRNGAEYGTAWTPSIDMIAARAWEGRTRFRSLELAVSRRGFGDDIDRGGTSCNGPNSYNPPEYSARVVYDRLFGMGFDGSGTAGSRLLAARRKLLVDVVRPDIARLKTRLGAADRVRLDQHLEGLRALEVRLSEMPSACTPPARAEEYPSTDGREQLEEIARAMSDVLVAALACDLTRVFTFQFTGMQVNTFFWMTGASAGLHDLTHDEPSPQPMVHQTVVYTMRQFAYLLEKLASTPEGAGNLLDRCCILATSEVADGQEHSYEDMPVILAGGAGGALRSGVHQRYQDALASRVLLTALHAVDVPVGSVGRDLGETTSPLNEIMA